MKKGLPHFLLSFFLLFCGLPLAAQDLPFQTWFEQVRNENTHEISVHFLSSEDDISLMTYIIEVVEENTTLDQHTKKGQFLGVPQLPTLLASINFQLANGKQGKVALNHLSRKQKSLERRITYFSYFKSNYSHGKSKRGN